ncbi:MAG: JAB domain-containing protein [Oscillospiraceae bacterium]
MVNAVDISVRRLVELALKNKAASLVLAHNRPEGIALPSREDEAFTRKAGEALRLMGMELVDHIIVAGDRYFSMRDSGLCGKF